jgi:tetratricopeptide (TPR) repeat protein
MPVRQNGVDLRRFLDEEDFVNALELIRQRERYSALGPDELVLKARILQLLPTKLRASLDEALATLQLALRLDSEYVPALLELGWFYYNVENQPRLALPLFERALEVSRADSVDAIVGLIRCTKEMGSADDALQVLVRATRLTDPRIDDEVKELADDVDIQE